MPGSALRTSTLRPLQAARKEGMTVAGFPSRYAAVLRPRTGVKGPGVMAMSSLPMRARDRGRQLRLVDLSVAPVANQFLADNPRINLSIGDRAVDGVRLTDRGVSIVPLGVADVPGVASGEAVAFLNTGRDSDHIVQVTPAGVDSQVSIRSAAAPTRYRYRIDVPAGGALRERTDGSIWVMQDGRRVGLITTPQAWDADHRAIPVTSSLTANVLTLDVGLQGRDVRFPATLDPNYVDLLQYRWYTTPPGANGTTMQGWSFSTNAPAAMNGIFGNYAGGANGQTTGLYAGTRGNQATYAGYYAYWHYTAPGTTSVIQTEWTRLSQIYSYAVGPPPCIDYGLTTTSATWATLGRECGQFTPDYRLSRVDTNPDDGFDYYPNINGAQFGAYVPTNTFANISDYLGEATIYLSDPEDPTVTLTSQPPSAWTDTPSGTIAATANDPGLGVQSMSIDGAGTVNNSGCLYAGPCPNSMSRSAAVSSLGLPEGSNTVNVTARDASYFSSRNVSAQHQTIRPVTVRLDRGAPNVTASGTLWDARNTFVGPGKDFALHVSAGDGDVSQPSLQRSGVIAIKVTMDGQTLSGGTATQTCTRPEGSCPLALDVTLTAAQLAAAGNGHHTIAITATDALNHTSPATTIDFDYDAIAPTLQMQGSLADMDGQVLTEDSYRLDAQAVDSDSDLYGAGMASVRIDLDGQPQGVSTIACFGGDTCEQARFFAWDASQAANRDHTITVTATDKAGNSSTDTVDVDLERAPSQPARTTTQQRLTINGASDGDQAGTAVTALGDLNDDGYADYAVGAPTSSASGRQNAGNVWIVMGRADSATVDLANPGPGVTQISGPSASSYCGTSIAAAGDINGDGIDDMLIGCPGVDGRTGALTATGRVYVVFSRPDPQTLNLASVGSAGFAITGPTDSLDIGYPLLAARPTIFGERLQNIPPDQVSQDVNGDGLADIVLGDSAVKRGAQNATGATYVIYGKANSATVDATALGTGGYVIRGSVSDSMSGYAATITDDLDGDSLADIVIGAPGQKPTTGGRAYIVHGAADSDDVDLGAGAGRVVTLTSGQANDRFGANVVALGDTDLSGQPDFAIATASGAYVVRNAPTSNTQITASDGYTVTGPANDAPLGTTVPAASIASAGDIDDDGRDDLAIGYPDAASNARGYIVQSPEASRTLNVNALPGEHGTGLGAGSQSDRSGASIAGYGTSTSADSTVTEPAQAIIGAPGAAPSSRLAAGQAYVLTGIQPPAQTQSQASSLRAAATPIDIKKPCGTSGYNDRTTPYAFQVGPTVRFGYRVDVDTTTNTADYSGLPPAFLPRCRRTIRKHRDMVPKGFRKAGQKYTNLAFTGAADAGGRVTWPIYDSFDNQFASVRQTLKTVGSKRFVDRWEVIRNSDNAVVLGGTPDDVSVSAQGYACSLAANRAGRVMFSVGVRPNHPVGSGVRGFIERNALQRSHVSDNDLKKGDTRCQTPRNRLQPVAPPAPLSVQNLSTESVSGEQLPLLYQGKTSAQMACKDDYTRKTCGAPYDTYEPSAFPGIKIMALSTTGVSGGEHADLAGGGVALAVVRADGRAFARLDRIGYSDPNVPCGRRPSVRWFFGNANPGRGKQGIYGWLPELHDDGQPARTCPAPAP